jgi:hypothetical protein
MGNIILIVLMLQMLLGFSRRSYACTTGNEKNNELQKTRGKRNANSIHFTHPNRRAHRGLFIGEIKGLIIWSEPPLTNHYISKVHSLKDITDYYCL